MFGGGPAPCCYGPADGITTRWYVVVVAVVFVVVVHIIAV